MSSTIELLLLFLLVLALLTKPMGLWLLPIAQGRAPRCVEALDAKLMALLRIRPDREQNWAGYALSLMAFNAAGLILLYLILRLQGWLPLNPEGFPGMTADQALNTAVSFVTNTNWQSYGGETTLSPLSQMLGLTVQNFVSAATGIAAAFVVMRGLARRETTALGNFWADLVRLNLWVLLPLSFVFALALVAMGSVQTFDAAAVVGSLSGGSDAVSVGPVASQEAIKLLGTNGGGFFNVNSAHPFENPTALANFLECLAIFVISAGLTHTFGRLVGDTRQGWTIWAAMAVMFVAAVLVFAWYEHEAGGFLAAFGASPADMHMEGKEARFALSHSSLFSVVTTSASCGAVNNMHDSLSPIAGAVPTLLMLLGEVVFGGVGAGFYGMMVFIIVAVFVAGLMVGRTPEYVGKKIGVDSMKLASIAMLVTPILVLTGTAASVFTDAGVSSIANPGPHGFSEVLYAWASAANNNGSAFAGLNANTPWYNIGLAAAMWFGRFIVIAALLALAGSLSTLRYTPPSAGTLATHGALFCGLLVGTVLLVGALTYLPALALGAVAEYVMLPF